MPRITARPWKYRKIWACGGMILAGTWRNCGENGAGKLGDLRFILQLNDERVETLLYTTFQPSFSFLTAARNVPLLVSLDAADLRVTKLRYMRYAEMERMVKSM